MAVFKPVTEVILTTSCCNSRFILCQTFSIMFRSGDCAGHDSVLILLLRLYSMTDWSVVIVEDIVLLRKMPCNNWPQIFFQYLLILFGIYISIYKCKSSHSVECKAPPEHNSKLLRGGGAVRQMHSVQQSLSFDALRMLVQCIRCRQTLALFLKKKTSHSFGPNLCTVQILLFSCSSKTRSYLHLKMASTIVSLPILFTQDLITATRFTSISKFQVNLKPVIIQIYTITVT